MAAEAPQIKDKKEEPVTRLDEPSVVPDFKAKEEEPVLTLDEPSVVPEFKEKEGKPVITLDEASGPPVMPDKEDLPVTHLESERDLAAVALAEAVEEIKQYIHTEIKALKEEIQSLREQK